MSDSPDCRNSQYRKCVLVDGKCQNCGFTELENRSTCHKCGGDCYGWCEEGE